jgi:hypothetical protein
MDQSEHLSSKRSKKKKNSEKSLDDTLESTKSKKSKKKLGSSVGESLRSSASKASSLFPSSPKKKKKKKEKEKKNSKEDGADKYEAAEDAWHPPTDTKGQTLTSPKPSEGFRPLFNSPQPTISTSITKSRSDLETSSHLDIKQATPIDHSISKRGSNSDRYSLGVATLGSEAFGSISIDDDIPFWKKTTGGSRRNSPLANEPEDAPSLEEADTILDDDEDFFKLNRSKSKGLEPKKTRDGKYPWVKKMTVSQPPLSDDSDEESSSSGDDDDVENETPEWETKKKMFSVGKSDLSKVAYKPAKKETQSLPSAPPTDKKEAKIDDGEASKGGSLPSWANARKGLKTRGNARFTSSPTKTNKVENETPEKDSDKEDEQGVSKAGVPSWASARSSLRKTGTTRLNKSPTKTMKANKDTSDKDSAWKSDLPKGGGLPSWAYTLKKTQSAVDTQASGPAVNEHKNKDSASVKESEKKADEKDAPAACRPSWAYSLKKTQSTADTSTPASATNDDNNKDVTSVKEADTKDDETETAKAGLPSWASARRSLKKTGSVRDTAAPAPIVSDDNDDDNGNGNASENKSDKQPGWMKKKDASLESRTIKSVPPPTKINIPDTNPSNGRPAWANARTSLRPSGSLQPAPTKEEDEEQGNKDDAKIKSRPSSGGKPLWAKKKATVVGNTPDDFVPLKSDGGDDDESSLDGIADLKGEETAHASNFSGSVKDRLAMWGKPKQSKPNAGSSDEMESLGGSIASRKATIGKAQGEKSVSGDASVTSLGSKDTQGTTQSHRLRMAAYLGKATSGVSPPVTIHKIEYKTDSSKPPIAPWAKNRDQMSVTSEVTAEKKIASGAPRFAIKRNSGSSVKDRTKAWGANSHHTGDRDDASSIGTGGGFSVADGEEDEEKSVPSMKERMKTWSQTTSTKASKGVPTKVAITKQSPLPTPDQDEGDSESLKPSSPSTSEDNPKTKLNPASSTSETDSYGRNKAKTWSSVPSSVPAYAAGRMALKKVKKVTPPPEESRSEAPPLNRMYPSENLKKTEPKQTKEPALNGVDKKADNGETAKESNETESVASSLYSTKLRKVAPPDSSKWKAKKETMSASGHGATLLRRIEKQNEEKWKSPKVQDKEAGKMYSSQHELLRRVAPPIDDKGRGEDSKDELVLAGGVQPGDPQASNKKVIMLISTLTTKHDQKSAQDRAMTILKGMEIDPEQLETVDGAISENKERRNKLFDISGVRGSYPQFFLVDAKDKISYMADWEGFESMHDMKILSDSMNLNSSSKYESGDSLDDSTNSIGEFASDDLSVSNSGNENDDEMIEKNDIPDHNHSPILRKDDENQQEGNGGLNQDQDADCHGNDTAAEELSKEDVVNSGEPSPAVDGQSDAHESIEKTELPEEEIVENDKSAQVKDSKSPQGGEEYGSSPAIVFEEEIIESEEVVATDDSIPPTVIHSQNHEDKGPAEDVESTPETNGVSYQTQVDQITEAEEVTPPAIVEDNDGSEGEGNEEGKQSKAEDYGGGEPTPESIVYDNGDGEAESRPERDGDDVESEVAAKEGEVVANGDDVEAEELPNSKDGEDDEAEDIAEEDKPGDTDDEHAKSEECAQNNECAQANINDAIKAESENDDTNEEEGTTREYELAPTHNAAIEAEDRSQNNEYPHGADSITESGQNGVEEISLQVTEGKDGENVEAEDSANKNESDSVVDADGENDGTGTLEEDIEPASESHSVEEINDEKVVADAGADASDDDESLQTTEVEKDDFESKIEEAESDDAAARNESKLEEHTIEEKNTAIDSDETADAVEVDEAEAVLGNDGAEINDSADKAASEELLKILEESGALLDDIPTIPLSMFLAGKDNNCSRGVSP